MESTPGVWDQWGFMAILGAASVVMSLGALAIEAARRRGRLALFRRAGPEPWCARCRYCTAVRTMSRCPECGADLARGGELRSTDFDTPPRWTAVPALLATAGLWAVVVFLVGSVLLDGFLRSHWPDEFHHPDCWGLEGPDKTWPHLHIRTVTVLDSSTHTAQVRSISVGVSGARPSLIHDSDPLTWKSIEAGHWERSEDAAVLDGGEGQPTIDDCRRWLERCNLRSDAEVASNLAMLFDTGSMHVSLFRKGSLRAWNWYESGDVNERFRPRSSAPNWFRPAAVVCLFSLWLIGSTLTARWVLRRYPPTPQWRVKPGSVPQTFVEPTRAVEDGERPPPERAA